ncbi:MerR family transcriptional regulator [Paenibacillus terrae]|uniref:MerR family transcriptional regulator n=1 Tax=Paenibacillus terrae TaxID=159743 RepID=UPI001BAEA00F
MKKTGYRYYSILQYEVLGTIIELHQIGLSIEEINSLCKLHSYRSARRGLL